jgi:hypothetical protein
VKLHRLINDQLQNVQNLTLNQQALIMHYEKDTEQQRLQHINEINKLEQEKISQVEL